MSSRKMSSLTALKTSNFESNFQDIWPIDYKDEENREADLRTNIKKLIFYIIFLVTVTTVILGMIHPLSYTFTKVISDQFLETDFTSMGTKSPIKFRDIHNQADFWMYLHCVAIPNFLPDYYYSPFVPLANLTKDDKKLLYENSMLGVPRFREVKAKKQKCKYIFKELRKFSNECFYPYSSKNILKDLETMDLEYYDDVELPASQEEKKKKKGGIGNVTVIEGQNVTEAPSTNASATEEEDLTIEITYTTYVKPPNRRYYYGKVGAYDSGGFVQKLYTTLNQSLETIKALYSMWSVNRTSRAIFLDFSLYNANLNLLCICKLVFEIPATGMFVTSSSFETVKLIRYKDNWDFILLGLEYIICVFLFYFLVQELYNFYYYGLRYFTFFWSYINLLIILGIMLLIPLNTYKFLLLPQKIDKLDVKKYEDLEYIVYWENYARYLEGSLLFLVWIKLFRYFRIGRNTGIIGATMRFASWDLLIFLFLFFIIFIGYAQLGYLIFGEQLDQFSTLGRCLMTLLMTIIGDFDYYAIEKTNKVLAPIYFISFILFVYFILFTMFVAIITDTFLFVKNESKARKTELTIRAFFARFYRNFPRAVWRRLKCLKRFKFFSRFKFLSPPEDDVQPLKINSNTMMEKIKLALTLCNFTNLEIKLFFQKYGISEDGVIDDASVQSMLDKVKRYKENKEAKVLEPDQKISIDAFVNRQEHLLYLQKFVKVADEKLHTIARKYRPGLQLK